MQNCLLNSCSIASTVNAAEGFNYTYAHCWDSAPPQPGAVPWAWGAGADQSLAVSPTQSLISGVWNVCMAPPATSAAPGTGPGTIPDDGMLGSAHCGNNSRDISGFGNLKCDLAN